MNVENGQSRSAPQPNQNGSAMILSHWFAEPGKTLDGHPVAIVKHIAPVTATLILEAKSTN
jgi:hypothetical protein